MKSFYVTIFGTFFLVATNLKAAPTHGANCFNDITQLITMEAGSSNHALNAASISFQDNENELELIEVKSQSTGNSTFVNKITFLHRSGNAGLVEVIIKHDDSNSRLYSLEFRNGGICGVSGVSIRTN